MIWETKQSIFNWLDRQGHRSLVANLCNLELKLRGQKARFSVDEDGDWIETQREAVFVSPDILVRNEEDLHQRTLEAFCHQYRLQPGDTVLDIGAGVGDDTVAFSKLVGPTGRVISVEANPSVFRCLEKTISQSRLANVTPVCCAITDKKGEVTIEDCGGSGHIENSLLRHRGAGVRVSALSIADLLEGLELKEVDLLKMNIEGAEKMAVNGIGSMFNAIRHHVVSCHDFVADRDGVEDLRTFKAVFDFFNRDNIEVTIREDDVRPWIKNFIYARNLSIA